MSPALPVSEGEGRGRPGAGSLGDLHLALRRLVEASRAVAGAVCLFDPEEAVLRLAIEMGLSDEGCRVLRAIRLDDEGWRAPLTSLLDRKACILEDQPGYPIPPLLQAGEAISTVACVPLYGDDQPLGSAVLIAVLPASLTGETTDEIAPEVCNLERAISGLHHQADAVTNRSLDGPGVIESIVEALLRSIDLAVEETQQLLKWAERFSWLRSFAEQLHAPLARNRRRIRQLELKTQALWQELEQAEIAVRSREAGEMALRARLYDAEARVSRQRQRVEALKREHERSTAELEEVLQSERRAREEMERSIERSNTIDREETLARARQIAESAEEARAGAVAELETTRAELAVLRADFLAVQEQVRQARRELHYLRSAKDTLERERQQLAASLEDARGRERRAEQRIAEVEEQAQALGKERRRVENAQEELEAIDALWRTRLYDTEARVCRHRQGLYILGREHERTKAELAEAVVREQRTREELESLIEQCNADREKVLNQARQLVEAADRARAAAAAETELVRSQLAESQRINVETRDEVQDGRAKIACLEAAARTARAEQERLAAALDEARTGAAAATRRLEHLEEELTALRSTTTGKVGPGVGAPPPSSRAGQVTSEEPSARQTLVVLDADPAWKEVKGPELEVEVIEPGIDLPERLSRLDFSHMVVNLAAPGVFDALVDLRTGGYPTGFWGCLAERGADEVLMLGMVEPIARPLDVDVVLVWLACFAQHGARILAAGASVNAFISLREALTRAGMSVSIAWDTKQTVDLLGMVRPQVVILDLELPPHGALEALIQISALDPLPSVALIQGTADPAPDLVTALTRAGADIPKLSRELCLAKLGAY